MAQQSCQRALQILPALTDGGFVQDSVVNIHSCSSGSALFTDTYDTLEIVLKSIRFLSKEVILLYIHF